MKKHDAIIIAMLAAAVACGQAARVNAGPGAGVHGKRVTPIVGGQEAIQPAADEGRGARDENAESRAIYQAAVSNVLAAVGYTMKTPVPMMDAETRLQAAAALNRAADKIKKGK